MTIAKRGSGQCILHTSTLPLVRCDTLFKFNCENNDLFWKDEAIALAKRVCYYLRPTRQPGGSTEEICDYGEILKWVRKISGKPEGSNIFLLIKIGKIKVKVPDVAPPPKLNFYLKHTFSRSVFVTCAIQFSVSVFTPLKRLMYLNSINFKEFCAFSSKCPPSLLHDYTTKYFFVSVSHSSLYLEFQMSFKKQRRGIW